MKIIFKLIFLISLIINALTTCAGKNEEACKADNTCQWDDEVIQTCSPITNVLTTECAAKKASEVQCQGIVKGNTQLCLFTQGASSAENTCVPIDTAISGLCGTDAAKASESACKGIKSGEIDLCSFTAGVEEGCNTLPETLTTTTIKVKSVKGKAVGITIEPVEAEKNQLLTGDTTI